ncbi:MULTISPECIES: DUF475 domain-containing protein [Sanguibacter]|jgi:hypothetical protein|uniref:DUF475 domain-containing protein n=1 Tax=Sanguibacter inulinus TaxID=60922 RepID=A0A853F0B9_9MICO|nr:MULTISPECIES: DUF475 domain-containing protein [Sanguibacter]KQT99595.1 hypothetical protein ASG53_01705 [Sanguibacter sp. Leaf3]MBF0724127.1 DUF475 domain-containing protein [Sanguibacter inulinus]NYS95272.1 DUF475 domain-containing protein [Sanguibacter inulinus]
MILRTFGWSFVVTALALVTALFYGGPEALFLCLILAVLEVSLSFDNAVVNAKVLERMSEAWQKIFLTVGVLIAVFGMRLVFPLLVVSVTAGLGPIEAVRLAMEKGDVHEPGSYGYILAEAHPQIAAFGGLFLLMLFLDFVLSDREITWLSWIERPLARAGKLANLSVVIAAIALVLASELLAEDPHIVLLSGVLGMITYLAVNGLGSLFEDSDMLDDDVSDEDAGDGSAPLTGRPNGPTTLAKATGKAGFFLFLYLEVLDASFSFDGVIGAFAITADPIIIALGLGFIGAMFVRSITIFLVRKGTLAEYVYLEHGAHWAIGALATILLLSIKWHINEVVTGLIGVVFIGAAFWSSLRHRRRHGVDGPESTGTITSSTDHPTAV